MFSVPLFGVISNINTAYIISIAFLFPSPKLGLSLKSREIRHDAISQAVSIPLFGAISKILGGGEMAIMRIVFPSPDLGLSLK